MSEIKEVLSPKAIELRIEVTRFLSKIGALNQEGLLPNRRGVAEFVDNQGKIDMPGLRKLYQDMGERVVMGLTDFLNQKPAQPHWSRKIKVAEEKRIGEGRRSRRNKRQGPTWRGPKRHSGREQPEKKIWLK